MTANMQGFNMGRYVPPDVEGTTSGNNLHKKRAPGSTRKDGTQTVRFEMPFAVWCHTCQPHAIIGQGVRFNAEKKKVGYYYSTPIWQFRLKHAACAGTLEIRTDPKNTAYVVTAGGKARDYGDPEDKIKEGHDGVPILTAEERERRREDAFAQLEGKVEEQAHVKQNAKRIEELYESREKAWEDPWSANRTMRDSFRRERKVRKREEEATQALKDRLGTDIDILPATEQDNQRARLVTFGSSGREDPLEDSELQPFVPPTSISIGSPRKSASKTPAKTQKEMLRQRLWRSTRAALDPFG